MIRSDAGLRCHIYMDAESGPGDQVVLVTASYGLGEAIIQGIVNR